VFTKITEVVLSLRILAVVYRSTAIDKLYLIQTPFKETTDMPNPFQAVTIE
ncbi:hypothetical protein L9F63_019606, partial [Diploptera punctata]